MANTTGQSRYRCECGKEFNVEGTFYLHRRNCSIYIEYGLANGSILKCGLCDYYASNLHRHIKAKHNITIEEYTNLYGVVISQKTLESISQNVSYSILTNPNERRRRGELLSKLNQTNKFREKASQTAIITSSRPDIQQVRSQQLQRWRENNPDQFEKCWKQMIDSPIVTTKPERWFWNWLNREYFGQFKRSQFIYSTIIPTKSHKKQIDFMSLDREIWIEIDGMLHFQQRHRNDDQFELIKQKDIIVNQIASMYHIVLIRFSYDQWVESTGRVKDDCLANVKCIIDNKISGIYLIGREYIKLGSIHG